MERDFVKLVYGGAEQGEFLCRHPEVDRIHLTGSAATFDAIVWGGKPKVGPDAESATSYSSSWVRDSKGTVPSCLCARHKAYRA